MSIFGWRVRHEPRGTPQTLNDPITGTTRVVPIVGITAERSTFTRQGTVHRQEDFLHAPVNIHRKGDQSQTCYVIGSGVLAPHPAVPSFRVCNVRAEEACYDAVPSVHLELSHAYNRRVYSRGSMQHPSNLVAKAAELSASNPERRRQNQRCSALLSPSRDTCAERLVPVPPIAVRDGVVGGLRFVRRPQHRAASDSILIHSARADNTVDTRCAHHACGLQPAQQELRMMLRETRPLTARAVIRNVETAVRSRVMTSRPVSARTSNTPSDAALTVRAIDDFEARLVTRLASSATTEAA